MNRNRRGKFNLDREFINKCINGEISEELLKEFLSNFIIVKAETLFESDTVEYVAYSNLFEEVSQNTVIPKYDIVLTKSIITKIELKRL